MNEWIDWDTHPVPNDVRGILIKYEIGVFSDRYDSENKRVYKDSKIIGWKFLPRTDPNEKTILCKQPERLNSWDALCVCDSLNTTNK